MVTPGIIKEDAINQLNKKGVQIVDPTILYQQYNRARRSYTGDFDWSWMNINATLSFVLDSTVGSVTNGMYIATMPTDWDMRYVPKFWTLVSSKPTYWTYASFASSQTPNQSTTVYTVDYRARTVIAGTNGPVTAYMQYQTDIVDLPITTAMDANREPWNHGETVTNLLIAYYWLATERQSGKHETFMNAYQMGLKTDISRDIDKEGVLRIQYPRRKRR